MRAGGRECIRQGTNDDLLRGCNSNGVRDQTIPAMRCAGLPTQQQATHHPAIHGYESLPDLCPVQSIRLRSTWEGCSPWFPPIRSDGLRGRMLGCRVPSGWVVWYGLIVARMGGKPLEVCQQFVQCIGIDSRIVPLHPITGLPQHPSDLTISHTTDKLIPGGLIGAAVLNTCDSSVVEELIIVDPKSNIPGLVVCPSIVGVAAHRVRCRLVWVNCSTSGGQDHP